MLSLGSTIVKCSGLCGTIWAAFAIPRGVVIGLGIGELIRDLDADLGLPLGFNIRAGRTVLVIARLGVPLPLLTAGLDDLGAGVIVIVRDGEGFRESELSFRPSPVDRLITAMVPPTFCVLEPLFEVSENESSVAFSEDIL